MFILYWYLFYSFLLTIPILVLNLIFPLRLSLLLRMLFDLGIMSLCKFNLYTDNPPIKFETTKGLQPLQLIILPNTFNLLQKLEHIPDTNLPLGTDRNKIIDLITPNRLHALNPHLMRLEMNLMLVLSQRIHIHIALIPSQQYIVLEH